MDIVAVIRSSNAGREPERLAMKYLAMRGDALAFLRGTCHLFYARLRQEGLLLSAPIVWSCGDLHLENFGSYKGDDRNVRFDLNDFDEAALAPASWDLVRMLASLDIAGSSVARGVPESIALRSTFLDAYADALASGRAQSVDIDSATGLVRELLDGLRRRDRAAFLDKRSRVVGGVRRLRLDNGKALAATVAQSETVRAFMVEWAKSQPDPGFFDVLDVARRIAGTGSLGVDRFVVLVSGNGSPDKNYLLDLKQAMPSALSGCLSTPQPVWSTEAERTTWAQQAMQSAPNAFLHAVRMDGNDYVLSALQPSEDRVTLSRSTEGAKEIAEVVATMGQLVAWAQRRASGKRGPGVADGLVDFGRRNGWKDELREAAVTCADQVREDYGLYCTAYDQGQFDVA